MDELIKRISERLSDQSSRRGFFSKMGKVALATAAILTGQGIFAQVAEAAPACCTNDGTYICSHQTCPGWTHQTYTWTCHSPGVNGTYTCHDCTNKNAPHQLVCVYATYVRG